MFLKISLILKFDLLSYKNLHLTKPHFKDENVLHNKQAIISNPTQSFLVTFVPQSFTIATQHETLINSGLRNCIPFFPHLAGGKSKVTQQK